MCVRVWRARGERDNKLAVRIVGWEEKLIPKTTTRTRLPSFCIIKRYGGVAWRHKPARAHASHTTALLGP